MFTMWVILPLTKHMFSQDNNAVYIEFPLNIVAEAVAYEIMSYDGISNMVIIVKHFKRSF
jgi:hypothetical protein